MRLFSKLIVWFVLAYLSSVAVTLLVALPAYNAVIPRYSVVHDARKAVDIYEAGGSDALRVWLRARRDEGLSKGMLYSADGAAVLLRRRPLPPEWRQNLGYLLAGRDEVALPRGWRLLAASAKDSEGRDWRWVAMLPPPIKPPLTLILVRLALGIAVLVLGAWWVARRLTKPLERLQSVSRELAAGQLDSRVPEQVTTGNDEIATLGRDFNHMVERLQVAIEGQQQLLRDVSHELRSPLGRLQIAVELARVEPSEELLDRIALEGERLEAMLADILSLARWQEAEATRQHQPVDLVELLRSVSEDAAFEAQQRKVRVADKLPPVARVSGDEALLRAAFDNVVRNALRYTPQGGSIEISLVDTGGLYVVQIADDGPGVDEASLARIFLPFHRESTARDRASGGYGLGLAITARAIEAHNGEVSAQNRAGGGLAVTLKLPHPLNGD